MNMDSLFSIIVIIGVFISIFSKVKKVEKIRDYKKASSTVQRPNSMQRPVIVERQSPNRANTLTVQTPMTKTVQERDSGYDLSGNKMERMQSNDKLLIANRLFEGDMPPKGYLEKKCGYCGASNIIPTYSNNKYGCYFCNEKL